MGFGELYLLLVWGFSSLVMVVFLNNLANLSDFISSTQTFSSMLYIALLLFFPSFSLPRGGTDISDFCSLTSVYGRRVLSYNPFPL